MRSLSLYLPADRESRQKTPGRQLTAETEYVQKYANKDAADEAGAETEDDDDMSSVASFGEDEDEEPAGQMDDV